MENPEASMTTNTAIWIRTALFIGALGFLIYLAIKLSWAWIGLAVVGAFVALCVAAFRATRVNQREMQ